MEHSGDYQKKSVINFCLPVKTLSSLEDCLANYIGKISDNVEYGTMLAKSLRYDLEEVVI